MHHEGSIQTNALRVKHTARAVTADLYAQAIWRTGDMSTAHDQLDRSIIRRMYQSEVPTRAAAAWLNRSSRWLHKLASRRPKKAAPHEPLQLDVLQWLVDHAGRQWTADQVTSALQKRDVDCCLASVEAVLVQLVKVRQVTESRFGSDRHYSVAESVRVYEAEGVQDRAEAVARRAEAIPEIIEQYVGGKPGAAFGVVRCSVPLAQEARVLARIRQAISAIVHDEASKADDANLGPSDVSHMSLMLLSGVGSLGTLHMGGHESHEGRNA